MGRQVTFLNKAETCGRVGYGVGVWVPEMTYESFKSKSDNIKKATTVVLLLWRMLFSK